MCNYLRLSRLSTYAQVEDITGLEVPHELRVKRSHSTQNETYAVVNQVDVVINGILGTGPWATVSAGVYRECNIRHWSLGDSQCWSVS